MKRRFAEFQTAGADARNDVGQDGSDFFKCRMALAVADRFALGVISWPKFSSSVQTRRVLPLGRIKSESQSESGDVNTQQFGRHHSEEFVSYLPIKSPKSFDE